MKYFCISGCIFLAPSIPAHAQSVAPMEKTIHSFAENFVVQITIQNPYNSAQVSEITVFDADWKPLPKARLSQNRAYLGAKHSLTITALVPFEKQKQRHVYICHAITPRQAGVGAAYRGEVCGKYTARRLSV